MPKTSSNVNKQVAQSTDLEALSDKGGIKNDRQTTPPTQNGLYPLE